MKPDKLPKLVRALIRAIKAAGRTDLYPAGQEDRSVVAKVGESAKKRRLYTNRTNTSSHATTIAYKNLNRDHIKFLPLNLSVDNTAS
jgi:hypothetical protein